MKDDEDKQWFYLFRKNKIVTKCIRWSWLLLTQHRFIFFQVINVLYYQYLVNRSYFPYSFEMPYNYIINVYNFISFVIYHLIHSFSEELFFKQLLYVSHCTKC